MTPFAILDDAPQLHWNAAELYEWEGDRIRCDLCPTACRLHDSDVGACRVRRRAGDRMETATFASSVFHIDAVERKPLYHFRPGSKLLTLAAPGCTFTCRYCQNYRISQFGRIPSVDWSASPVSVDKIVELAQSEGAGIAFSYSEPALSIELTLAIAEAVRNTTIPIVWKTNGFLTPKARAKVAPVLSAANVDIKCLDPAMHRMLTGAPVEPVIETLSDFYHAGVWVEVSTPVIPGISSEPGQLQPIAEAIKSIDSCIPWHLLRVTPEFQMSASRPTSVAEIQTALEIGHNAGLEFVYVERALGAAGRSTKCAACSSLLIGRDIWALQKNHIIGGCCFSCGWHVPGRWQS